MAAGAGTLARRLVLGMAMGASAAIGVRYSVPILTGIINVGTILVHCSGAYIACSFLVMLCFGELTSSEITTVSNNMILNCAELVVLGCAFGAAHSVELVFTAALWVLHALTEHRLPYIANVSRSRIARTYGFVLALLVVDVYVCLALFAESPDGISRLTSGVGAVLFNADTTVPVPPDAFLFLRVEWSAMLIGLSGSMLRGFLALGSLLGSPHQFDPMDETNQKIDILTTVLRVAALGWCCVAHLSIARTFPFFMHLKIMTRLQGIFARLADYRKFQVLSNMFPDATMDEVMTTRSDTDCPICLSALVESVAPAAAPKAVPGVKVLPCGHCFHGNCLRRWLMLRSVCPYCQQPLHIHKSITGSREFIGQLIARYNRAHQNHPIRVVVPEPNLDQWGDAGAAPPHAQPPGGGPMLRFRPLTAARHPPHIHPHDAIAEINIAEDEEHNTTIVRVTPLHRPQPHPNTGPDASSPIPFVLDELRRHMSPHHRVRVVLDDPIDEPIPALPASVVPPAEAIAAVTTDDIDAPKGQPKKKKRRKVTGEKSPRRMKSKPADSVGEDADAAVDGAIAVGVAAGNDAPEGEADDPEPKKVRKVEARVETD